MASLSRTPHLKLQEMCDCYLETNFLEQLKAMGASKSTDIEEEGFKFLALALLQATTEEARKISFENQDGSVTATIKMVDRILTLPSPAPELMNAISTIIRDIIHLDEAKGNSPLILGLRNGQLDLRVDVAKDTSKECITIRFPEVEGKTTPSRVAVEATETQMTNGQTHWKCGKCKVMFTAKSPPEQCPECGEKCDFLNITCYTPDCGGPGNIDSRLA